MSFSFPLIIPNSITNLQLPDYGVQVYQFDSSTESRRFKYGTGNKTKIELKFEGRNGAEIANIISFYRLVKGMQSAFLLPPELFLHPVAYTSALSQLETTTLWRFNAPPQNQTVFTNIYNMNCPLISVFE